MSEMRIVLTQTILLTIGFIFGVTGPSWGQQATQKQICVSTFGMNWGTSEEAQGHLLSRLKREAIGELFGEAIWSVSEVKDLAVTRDEIHTFSAGLVRVRGNPRVFNGTGPGELCMTAELYVSEEDLRRLEPREIRKKICIADPRLSSGDIRTLAEQQARVQAVRDFEPGLQELPDEQVAKLLHEARIEDAGFVPETVTYCAAARGFVYPIELLAAARSPLSVPEAESALSARGTWQGTLREQGIEYPVHLVLNFSDGVQAGERVGTVDYPTLDCNGEMVLLESKSRRQYTLEETILRGRQNCMTGSRIQIELIADGTLRCTWLAPDGRSTGGVFSRVDESSGRTSRRSSAPAPQQVSQARRAGGLLVAPTGCVLTGTKAECEFRVTNERADRRIVLLAGRGSRIVNQNGYAVLAEAANLGTGEWTVWWSENNLPQDIPMRVTLLFEDVPSDSTLLTLVQLTFKEGNSEFVVKFRDIPLTR